MLQSSYLTETDLKEFGFRSLGNNVRISSDARIYGAENISISSNVRIDDFVILSAMSGQIEIGNHVFIARSCHVSGFYSVKFSDFSVMAANCVVYSASDDYSGEYLTGQAIPQEYTSHIGGPVEIGRHVIIGTGSTVLGKSSIGIGCSVGAMSLVNGDLQSWGIYAGVPCRRIKERKKKLLGLEQDFLAHHFGFSSTDNS